MSYLVTHELDVYAKCPADSSVLDHYTTTLTVVDRVIDVERVLREVSVYRDIEIWQEDLTQALADGLDVEVKTRGIHSGVVTTVIASPSE